MHLIAGINGAGKTTFYYQYLRPMAAMEFVNADEIEKQNFPNEIGLHSYEAGRLAAQRRSELITERLSFATETVFSHSSKLDLINECKLASYQVFLYYIHIVSPQLAAKRVSSRVSIGGHDVPEKKIHSRYPLTVQNIKRAIKKVDRTLVFDNSMVGKTHRYLMTFEYSELVKVMDDLPVWIETLFSENLSSLKQKHS